MSRRFPLSLALVAALALSVLSSGRAVAQAAEPAQRGTHGDWSVFTFRERNRPVCYIANRVNPRSGPNGFARGNAYILVTNRPAEKQMGVVSIVPGYTFRDHSTATVAVGGRKFTLYTQGDTAWANDSDDSQLVQLMRDGASLEFTGQPKEGGPVVDSYSLGGTVAAMDALDKACRGGGAAPAKKAARKKTKKKH